MVREVAENSIQGTAINIIEKYHTESYHWPKDHFSRWGQTINSSYKSGHIWCCAMCHSIYLIFVEAFMKTGLSFLRPQQPHCQTIVENLIINYFVNYENSST